MSVNQQLTLSRLPVPRNNCIKWSRTGKTIAYLLVSMPLIRSKAQQCNVFHKRSCRLYSILWTRVTRKNLKIKHIYCIFLKRLLHALKRPFQKRLFQLTCYTACSSIHAERDQVCRHSNCHVWLLLSQL